MLALGLERKKFTQTFETIFFIKKKEKEVDLGFWPTGWFRNHLSQIFVAFVALLGRGLVPPGSQKPVAASPK